MSKLINPYNTERRIAEVEAIERRANEERRYDTQMEIQYLKDRIQFSHKDDEWD